MEYSCNRIPIEKQNTTNTCKNMDDSQKYEWKKEYEDGHYIIPIEWCHL